ncbi:MAG TPA: hypothetical protein VE201_06915 [Nitrospirales bacterium]|nr:hypothetical protein [Nitrospirales bacterium]
MSGELLDEAMKTQLALDWDRLRKALSQAGDIGDLSIEELQVVATPDRKGLPPALSVAAIQGVLSAEKGNPRGQTYRAGEESWDQTQLTVSKIRAGEVRIQDAHHSEVYAALGSQAGRRLGLNERQAATLGDAMAYLITGWGQVHAEERYVTKLIYDFNRTAGSAPEGGFIWSDLHSLVSRRGFKTMVETARAIGTPLLR